MIFLRSGNSGTKLGAVFLLLAAFVPLLIPLLRGEEAATNFNALLSAPAKPGLYGDAVVFKDGDRTYKWSDAKVRDFGPEKVIFDPNGMRKLSPIPAPGIHPRIYITSEDLPELRRRFKETESGRLSWNIILAWTETMKGRYNPEADYCKPDFWIGFNGWVHGPAMLMPFGRGDHTEYQQLIKADMSVKLEGPWWGAFSMEALRCLITDDAQGAKDLAAAVMTAMRIDQKKREESMAHDKKTDPPDTPVGETNLAHVYDLIYQWLTPEQRRAMHDELAYGSWHGVHYGTFENATAARSTWATFCHHVIPLLAIEGEPGFNDIKLDACYRAWRNYLTYSINRSGCIFEGEGKLILGAGAVMAFSQRPRYDCLGAHPHLRRYADYFLPHSALATQEGFMGFDLLGNPKGHPNSVDVILMHYLYPHDKTIEWVYRKTMGEGYRNIPADVTPWGQMNCALFSAIFTTDFDSQISDPATLGLGNTFFDGERALLMTRSDWSTNALQFTMQTRQASGGHPYADRNSIQLIGSGRIWSGVNGSEMFENFCQSLVTIDGKLQDYHTPGRVVDFHDEPMATFMVGDAKYSWDYLWEGGITGHGWNFTREEIAAGEIEKHLSPGFELEPHAAVDFHYTHKDDSFETNPLSMSPTWLGSADSVNPVTRKINYPVKKAFRTAGLVRGKYPYLIVADDIQKDERVHRYDWILQLEPDLKIESITPKTADGVFDIILRGDPSLVSQSSDTSIVSDTNTNAPVPELLIRVLQRNEDPSHPLTNGNAYISDIKAGTWNRDIHRLIIPSDSVIPEYKVLLFPYLKGDPLPETKWDANKTNLSVSWFGQKDEISFTPSGSGKADVVVTRFNPLPTRLVAVNKPILPLAEPALEARAKAESDAKEAAIREFSTSNPRSMPGLIAYWNFDQLNSQGTGVPDALDPNRIIPLVGQKLVPSAYGKALQFSGEKEGVDLPVTLDSTNQKGFSIVLRVKGPDHDEGNIFSNNPNKGLVLHSLWGDLRCDAMGQWNWSPKFPRFNMEMEGWRQLAFTWDGKKGRLYLDQQLIQEAPGKLVFSGKSSLGGGGFNGAIDQLMLFDRAITPAELDSISRWEKYVLVTKTEK